MLAKWRLIPAHQYPQFLTPRLWYWQFPTRTRWATRPIYKQIRRNLLKVVQIGSDSQSITTTSEIYNNNSLFIQNSFTHSLQTQINSSISGNSNRKGTEERDIVKSLEIRELIHVLSFRALFFPSV